MLVRKNVLLILSALSLSLTVGCGPAFKSGRDKSSTPKPLSEPAETGSPQAPAGENSEGTDGAVPADADREGSPAARLIPINEAAIAVGDKLIQGVSLIKGDKKLKLELIMKDQDGDARANVELNAELSTEVNDNSAEIVSQEKISLEQLGADVVNLDKTEYSVEYKCLSTCTNVEVVVQRVTGELTDNEGRKTLTGFRITFKFEVNGTEPNLVLKSSDLTLGATVKSSNEARAAALISIAQVEPEAAVPAPAPAPAVPAAGAPGASAPAAPAPASQLTVVATPQAAAAAAARITRQLAAQVNAVPKEVVCRRLPGTPGSRQYQLARAQLVIDARNAQVAKLRAQGVQITDAQAATIGVTLTPRRGACPAPGAAARPAAPAQPLRPGQRTAQQRQAVSNLTRQASAAVRGSQANPPLLSAPAAATTRIARGGTGNTTPAPASNGVRIARGQDPATIRSVPPAADAVVSRPAN